MRIKNYDYDTCIKLKNPLTQFNVVEKFILESFEFIVENEYLNIKYYKNKNGFFSYIDYKSDEININYTDDFLLDDIIIRVSNSKPTAVYNLEWFSYLREDFLNYLLNKKLNIELNTTIIKKKVSKI